MKKDISIPMENFAYSKWNIPLNEFFRDTEIENFYTIILKSAAGRIEHLSGPHLAAGRILPIIRLPDRGQWPDLGLAAKIMFWLQPSSGDTKYYINLRAFSGHSSSQRRAYQ